MKVKFHLDKKKKPQVNDGIKVTYGLAKRSGYRIRWFLILALILSPLVIASYYFYKSNVLIIAPAVLTSKPIIIEAHDNGIVRLLSVEPGDEVEESTILLVKQNRELNAEIQFIRNQLASLQQPVFNPEARYLKAIADAKTNLAKVIEIQRRYENFREQGRISELDYAGITGMVNSQNKQVNDLYIELDEARRLIEERKLSGPVIQQRRILEKELVSLKAQRNELTVFAPFKGKVLEVHVVEGERVEPGDELITMIGNEKPRIVAFLEPKYLQQAKPNTKVIVVFPDRKKLSATVSEDVELVSKLPTQLASPFEGTPAFLRVLIDLDTELDKSYKIEGLTVEVHFDESFKYKISNVFSGE